MTDPSASTTLVTFLLDRTGSMGAIRDDTIGGFNTYLEGLQADPDGVLFSLIQFDSMSVDTIHKNKPVAEVAKLTTETFVPRASTPLIDAAVKTIKAVEKAVAERTDAPKIIICFQTDGQENCSTQHTWAELNALIKEKAALGWQFNFMGSGIDAYAQASQMGIAAVNAMSYDSADPKATRMAFAASASNTMDFARSRSASTAYSGAQRTAAKDRFAAPDLTATPEASKSLVDDISL